MRQFCWLKVCNFAKTMLLYKYFPRFLCRFVVIYKEFTNLYFPENLLVAAVSRCKVLKKFISIKVQYICRDADYRLKKPKMLSVLNGNLIVLIWQNIHVVSNLKYTATYIKTWPSSLHSAEAYSEPFQTSKQGDYLLGGNYFHKKLHLRHLKRF